MKFIHIADVHLGAVPESDTALGEIRKQEIWDAFSDMIDYCEQERVELLFIAGDLFHSQPLLREVKEVDYLFRKLTKTKVVMIAGNHDCLLPSSHYYDVTFPENVVFLMDSKLDSVYFPDLNTEVYGLSYEKKQIAEARCDEIVLKDTGRINILLAHGNIHCTDKSLPLHKEKLEKTGFDYVALGHLHTEGYITKRIAYAGAFEPIERKETGKRGYIEGTLTKTGVEPAVLQSCFVPHAKREYIPLSLTLTKEMTKRQVFDWIKTKKEQIGRQHMYLVELKGVRARELDGFTKEEAKEAGVLELYDHTVPDFPVDSLLEKNADNLIGMLIERATQLEDKELQNKVLQYGLWALLVRD